MKLTKLMTLLAGLVLSANASAQATGNTQPNTKLVPTKRIAYCTTVSGDVKENAVLNIGSDMKVSSASIKLSVSGKEVIQKEGSKVVFLDTQNPQQLKALKVTKSQDGKTETHVTGSLRTGVVVDLKDGTDLRAPKQGEVTVLSNLVYMLCENFDTYEIVTVIPKVNFPTKKEIEEKKASNTTGAGAGADTGAGAGAGAGVGSN